MSLNSWKKEFYPIPAWKCSKKNALAHSLQKWKGLRSSNLKRHGVIRDSDGDIYCQDGTFHVDAESCALCHQYLDRDLSHMCSACPLSIDRGGFNCDQSDRNGDVSQYWIYRDEGDPEPMIRLLTKVLKRTEKKKR